MPRIRIVGIVAAACLSVLALSGLGTAESPPPAKPTATTAEKPKLTDEFPELAPALVKALAEELKDVGNSDGQHYARILRRLGPAAMKPLVEMLASDDKAVRMRALNVLFFVAGGNEHAREAIPALIKVLNEGDDELQGAVLMILDDILVSESATSTTSGVKLPVQGAPLIRGQLLNVTFTRQDGTKASLGSSEGLDDDLVRMGATISVYPEYLVIESRGIPRSVVIERYNDLHEVILAR